jgi:DNA helicase-2/ATP-dependent DNA helicase PcrA
MDKHKDDREDDMLVKYLTETNCMRYLTKYGEQNERDLVKMMSNVDVLIDISTKYDSMEEFYNQIALFSGETQLNRDEIKKGVKVMTIHSSKGLEYKHVFLPFWNVGNVPM